MNGRFEKIINEAICSGGVFGNSETSSDVLKTGDNYAPGDARIPVILGSKSKKHKKSKKNRKILVIKRNM